MLQVKQSGDSIEAHSPSDKKLYYGIEKYKRNNTILLEHGFFANECLYYSSYGLYFNLT